MSITLTTVILFAVFGVLLFLGVPISISIVVSSIAQTDTKQAAPQQAAALFFLVGCSPHSLNQERRNRCEF